jgi:hypothetical protein
MFDALDNDGGVTGTTPGPTLPLSMWRHLAVELGATGAALTTDGSTTIKLSRSCSSPIRADLGIFDSTPPARAGQWKLLFDSFRFYNK